MNKRVRLLAYEEFSGHMGIGRRDGGYVDQDKWRAVEPESVNQALWELVCASPAQPAAREPGVSIAAAPPVRRHIAQRHREWAAGIIPSHPLRAVRSAGVLDEIDDGYHKKQTGGWVTRSAMYAKGDVVAANLIEQGTCGLRAIISIEESNGLDARPL